MNIFYATSTQETIMKILQSLNCGETIVPISPREPKLPKPFKIPKAIATCLHTSGTTGNPKYAMHSWENHYYNASFPHPDLLLTPDDCWRLSLPLNHVGGLAILFRCYLANAKIALRDQKTITHLSLVPTQLKRLIEKPDLYPNLKAILVGGAPIPYDLCLKAYKLGLPIYLTYGMTEMSSQIATQKFVPERGVNFGHPLPHREVKIAEDGEILVRGKTLFQGYLGLDPPFTEDGWFPTKDIGKMTPFGLEIYGRKDRMIISGGENIYLEELEKAIMELDYVLSSKVASREDKEYGKRPIARIETNVPVKIERIREDLSHFLPKYKIPDPQDISLIKL